MYVQTFPDLDIMLGFTVLPVLNSQVFPLPTYIDMEERGKLGVCHIFNICGTSICSKLLLNLVPPLNYFKSVQRHLLLVLILHP